MLDKGKRHKPEQGPLKSLTSRIRLFDSVHDPWNVDTLIIEKRFSQALADVDRLSLMESVRPSTSRAPRPSELYSLAIRNDGSIRRYRCRDAVYDRQSADAQQSFGANGSKVEHLALVLNRNEGGLFIGDHSLSPEALATTVADKQQAEVVIIKMGPLGVLVSDKGSISRV